MLDNAPYHTGEEIRDYLHKMQVPIIYSGPYSYCAAPVETIFSFLKLGELNEEGIATGKKNLQALTNLIASRLQGIPKHTRIKLFHYTTLWLFKYVCFE